MERVVELDETYQDGRAHLYLGGIETLLPRLMGGRPAKGKAHFERAIEIEERFLLSKVIYAEQYARLVFDQKLHDRLLEEVLSADPVAGRFTLTNQSPEKERQCFLRVQKIISRENMKSKIVRLHLAFAFCH